MKTNGKALFFIIAIHFTTSIYAMELEQQSQDDLAQLLEKYSGDATDALFEAAMDDDPEMICALVDRGANVNGLDTFEMGPSSHLLDHRPSIFNSLRGSCKSDVTPLYSALCFRMEKAVQTLIKLGADVDTRIHSLGDTSLHRAVKEGLSNASKAILLADKQKPMEKRRWFPFFYVGLDLTKEEQLQASQDRIFRLRFLCSITDKDRCENKSRGSFMWKEQCQDLPSLPLLPPELQDLIISYLPDDIDVPTLARLLKNLYRGHLERCLAMVEDFPRSWFVQALQAVPEGEEKQGIVEEITKQAIERAAERCKIVMGGGMPYERIDILCAGGLTQERRAWFDSFLNPDDPNGTRAEFIREHIEREFKEKGE